MDSMNNVLPIRKHLGMSQDEFGKAIGVSQGNVSHYELGKQEVSPEVARNIREFCCTRGVRVTLDYIYAEPSANATFEIQPEASQQA